MSLFLFPVRHELKLAKRLILASRSPRRSALLTQIGLNAEVIPAEVSEELDVKLSPAENAVRLAVRKAERVAQQIDNAIVVGADTIVAVDGDMLGKPADRNDAVRMLKILSGRTHVVHTGFALFDRPSNRQFSTVESTSVTFRTLPLDEIEEYVRGGSPMDKAGAYGIQDDYGAVFVRRIEGCYYNVMGFPLSRFYESLQEFQEQLIGT